MSWSVRIFLAIVFLYATPIGAGTEADQFELRELRYPDRGIIYVYRSGDERDRSSETWRVAIDGYVAGELQAGEYLSLERKRGNKEIMVQLGNRVIKQDVELVPLARLFVTVSSAHEEPQLVFASEEEALPVLEQLSIAWFKRDLHGTRLKDTDSGVVLVREPRVARGIRLSSDVQRTLRGGKCHVAYGLAFQVDTSGFPKEVRVTNASQFTPGQVELMIDQFEDYRFHTYRENGKPVARDGGKVQIFHGPYSECPTLPRDSAVSKQGELSRGQYCPPGDAVDAGWVANELWSSVRECVEDDEYERASLLMALAVAYSNYDDARVADPTVTYLTRMMFDDAVRGLDPRKGRAFDDLRASAKPGTSHHDQVCEFVERVGMPAYYPGYMIETGADYFLRLGGESLEGDFDGREYWNNMLSVMKCKGDQ